MTLREKIFKTFSVTIREINMHGGPEKFFEKYRLLHAKTLLEIENKSVKEVAYEMEFDSPQSFTRWFKNLDENNPTFYRKKK